MSRLAHVAQSDVAPTRMSAVGALGKVVLAVPDTADDILTIAGAACDDKDSSVRAAAVKTAASACQAAVRHVSECLSFLIQGLQDTDWQVRDTCVQAFGDVSKADPEVGHVALQ